jgi:hypothetical protein
MKLSRENHNNKVSTCNIMWNIFQSIFFSIILIVLSHWGFQYLKNWLTPHKNKDLVDFQIKKYKKMLEEIIQKKQIETHNENEEIFMNSNTIFNYVQNKNDEKPEFKENIFYEPSINEDNRSEMDSVDYKTMQKELLDFTKLI